MRRLLNRRNVVGSDFNGIVRDARNWLRQVLEQIAESSSARLAAKDTTETNTLIMRIVIVQLRIQNFVQVVVAQLGWLVLSRNLLLYFFRASPVFLIHVL